MILLKLYQWLTKSIAIPLVELHLKKRGNSGKEIKERMEERKGKGNTSFANFPEQGPLIWIHAASVGESLSILTLIDQLLDRYPFCRVMVTTGTVSSAALLEKKLPPRAFHQFAPFDLYPWVTEFLDRWRPRVAFWVESEIWPNLIWETAQRGIPLIGVNARISHKSFQRWTWVKSFIRPLFKCFDVCFAQSAEDAERLKALGAQTVLEGGNFKFASLPLTCDLALLKELKQQIKLRPVWIAASTHDPEEEIICKAHHLIKKNFPNLLTILIPRHPHRGNELRHNFEHSQKGLSIAQRSRKEGISDQIGFYMADTLGELGLFYHLASIVFIGGSFIPIGGHNLIEPAHLKAALLHGPLMSNFKEVIALFQQADAAIEVSSAEELAAHIGRLLQHPEECAQRGQRAFVVAQVQMQIVTKIQDEIGKRLDLILKNYDTEKNEASQFLA